MNLENFPSNETAVQMMQTITGNGFYDNSYIGKWLFQVMGQEIEDAKRFICELPEQAFPQSVTWGIGYQESKYGIPENTGKSLEERRRQIMLQKVFHSPMNPAFLERQVGLIVGHDRVTVIENVAPYIFRVEIQEVDDSAAVYEEVRRYVKKVKPSHLSLAILGKYLSEFKVDVEYSSQFCIISEFFPRLNTEWLLLDGSWKLDGAYLLDFYKYGAYIDFYPVKLRIGSEAAVKQEAAVVNEFLSEFSTKIQAVVEMTKLRSGGEMEIRHFGKMQLCSENFCDVVYKSHLRIERDLWYLDGTVPLDGTREMKAQVIEIDEL